MRTAFFISVLLLSGLASSAPAQTVVLPVAPTPSAIPVQVGPLLSRPAVLISAGGDSNVFNETAATQRSDFSVTATPRVDLWLRTGRTWVTGSVAEDLSWFRRYVTERTVSGRYSIGWVAPLGRMSAAAVGQLARVQERPGFEIDL